MPTGRLELPRPKSLVPKTSASTNSARWAKGSQGLRYCWFTTLTEKVAHLVMVLDALDKA